MDINFWASVAFWLGLGVTFSGSIAFFLASHWPIKLAIFVAYLLGAIGGLVIARIFLQVPSIKRKYGAQPEGMGSGVGDADLLVPCIIVGIMVGIALLPVLRGR